ncbi:Crossover junction endonuclease mus81 [Lithohypha guttulata]|nr:Crossover junction endonuclease mus81 [Lithohypha guttulata]
MAECANTLYAQWLSEMMEEPRIANGKALPTYRRALRAIKECKAVMQHASEAEDLNGIGKNICRALEEKHNKYCLENNLPLPQKHRKRTRNIIGAEDPEADIADSSRDQPPAKKRIKKQYVPNYRSGAYALMMALSELEKFAEKGLPKEELKHRAQPYTDASFFVATDNTKYYTAWKSIDTLLQKEYVCVKGHPTKRYCLTDEGWAAADQMRMGEATQNSTEQAGPSKTKNKNKPVSTSTSTSQSSKATATTGVVDLSSDSELESEVQNTPLPKLIPIKDSGPSATKSASAATLNSKPIILQPGTFEVKLLLDTREIQAKKNRDYIAGELLKQGIDVETRALPLGDAVWIAKVNTACAPAFRLQNINDDDEGSDEVVLEHVVERKRLDDLLHSLKDGRYHEQKFRLRKSGMRHVTYLIEDYSLPSETQAHWAQSIESSLAQMQVVDDIFVKRTAKTDDSIKYLARMTRSLKKMYEHKELHVLPSMSLDVAMHHKTLQILREKSPISTFCITFSAFCSLCDKSDSLTLRDLYLKMLMCMRGVTGDKAIEIQKIWPTPNAFIEAYSDLGPDAAAKKKMVSDRLAKQISRKQIGPTLSAGIAEVWGK